MKGKNATPRDRPAMNTPKTRQLTSGVFRMLNEELYTAKSDVSAARFKKEPALFKVYHEGYAVQVANWPVKPLDEALRLLKEKLKKNGALKVADVGCGEANVAKTLIPAYKDVEIRSFDIGRKEEDAELVTIANMTNLPIEDMFFDVALYSLSIMGVDQNNIFKEAHRILKENGLLIVIEITSRVPDREAFIRAVESFGFKANMVKDLNYIFSAVFEKKSDDGKQELK